MIQPLRTLALAAAVLTSMFASFSQAAGAQQKPNILLIMGDDIGYWNLSYNNRGMMGYQTPSIDQLAAGGMIFTDYYGEQSCTAGRSAFITGQSPLRTGLTKVGIPGADKGLQPEDPTLAELVKPLGYRTGQFGKNHFGDRDEFLPSNHGFDEFFGNLYHLNAEEEPEHEDYPQDPSFRRRFGPRGVIRSNADGTVEDSGPLTRKRMETVDEEFLAATVDFIQRSHAAEKPWLAWFNSTRMHYYTHVKKESQGKTGQGFYADGMAEHDGHVGQLLGLLDELGVSENTIVVYTTDNGPHYNEWPDGGITPFRGEKNTNWEGGFRVPAIVRWPGQIEAGSVSNEIVSHTDWVPTLMSAAGVPGIKQKLLAGHAAGARTYNVHLDGYDLLPYLTGKKTRGPRPGFIYFSDDGVLVATRHGDWKAVYHEQRARRFDVWRDPFVKLRIPKLFNLRRDPFERADTDSNNYNRWWTKRTFRLGPPQQFIMEFLATFRKYPPRQKPASFNLDRIMEAMAAPAPR